MTHGSLFSGIGGFDLAAQWIGWTNIFQCEIDPFCQKVLKYHFPESELFSDIKTSDFKKYANTIDVISGGFPCQPFSVAGKRKGTKDDRFLWDEMLRVIRDVKPSWVVAENVPGLLTQERGLVFERVCADLEYSGYEVQPFVIPACAVGAPHKRDRLFIIAHNSNSRIKGLQQQRENGVYGLKTAPNADVIELYKGSDECSKEESNKQDYRSKENNFITGFVGERITADSQSAGQQTWNERQGEIKFRRKNKRDEFSNNWDNFPTQSPVRGKYDGVSEIMVRNIKSEIYGTICKKYRNKDLFEVRKAFSKEEIWEQIRRCFKIQSKEILFKTMQLFETPNLAQGEFSSFGEKASEKLLRKLRKYGELARTPQGREYKKQFDREFGDTLPHLSFEIALATREIQEACASFSQWYRAESIRAYGNAVVPQVIYQIFKAIDIYENSLQNVYLKKIISYDERRNRKSK